MSYKKKDIWNLKKLINFNCGFELSKLILQTRWIVIDNILCVNTV